MKRILFNLFLLGAVVGAYIFPVSTPILVPEVHHFTTHEVVRETTLESTGASLPQAPAVFETSLASPISTSATSLTLTANSVRGGSSLSGFNCFTIDEGTASREDVCGTVSSTAVTGLTRGINPANGTSTVASLQFTHRRGASVKVTDFPTLTILRNQLAGTETLGSTTPLRYDGSFIPTVGQYALATWDYIKAYSDGLSFAGVATSTESNFGGVWLATQLQQASSTNGSPNSPYVLQSRYSTSTCAIAGLWTVITGNSGKITQSCLDFAQTTTWTGAHTFSVATTTLAATSTSPNGIPHFNNANFATTTAGGTINGYTLPVPVSLSTSTKRVVAMDGNDLLTFDNFMGFAVTNGTNGTEIVVQTDGVVNGFSGLTVGKRYYVNDAVGTISTTTGTYEQYVGFAASTTAIEIDREKGLQYLGTFADADSTAEVTPLANYFVVTATYSDDCGGNPTNTHVVQHILTRLGNTSQNSKFAGFCSTSAVSDISITTSLSGSTITGSGTGGGGALGTVVSVAQYR